MDPDAPEQRLALAVIAQALRDAAGDDQIAVRPAWSFLTDRSGAWFVARRTWCEVIGQDPDVLRRFALDELPDCASVKNGFKKNQKPKGWPLLSSGNAGCAT